MSSLLQLDGSCGPRSFGKSRIRRILLSDKAFNPVTSKPTTTTTQSSVATSNGSIHRPSISPDFVSQSTQTCICGLLEFDFVQRYTLEHQGLVGGGNPQSRHSSLPQQPPFINHQQNQQVGGHLAFHPFNPTPQHQALFQNVTSSEWSRNLATSATFQAFQRHQKIVPCLTSGQECPGCSSGVEVSGYRLMLIPVENQCQIDLEPSITKRCWRPEALVVNDRFAPF